MKQQIFTVIENSPLTKTTYKMVLAGKTCEIKSGGFVNIKLDGLYLRRPISVCDYNEDTLTIIYKVVGSGTEKMSAMQPNEKLDVLTGLGNGYNITKSGTTPLLIGGGVGVPPLYKLCKELIQKGCHVTVILGFNTAEEVFYEEEFKALGADTYVTTVDGSHGIKGFVTNAVKDGYSYVYTCGPEPMLKAVYNNTTTSGQYSFEERCIRADIPHQKNLLYPS